MLIAYLKAHMIDGEPVELLPVQHENDIKKEVRSLLESWCSSGFLIRDKYIYPWHRVQKVEVVIEQLSAGNAAQQMLALKGSDRARLHEDFWKGERQV